jgi:hypothetical protein
MRLDERKEVLKKSGLCLFCLKHVAEVECYGQGSFSSPSAHKPAVTGSTRQVCTSYWGRRVQR